MSKPDQTFCQIFNHGEYGLERIGMIYRIYTIIPLEIYKISTRQDMGFYLMGLRFETDRTYTTIKIDKSENVYLYLVVIR